MIEVKEQVEVPGTPEATWDLLRDPYAVAACVPGCELVAQRDDGAYDAIVTTKFGGIRVKFRALAWLTMDDETHTGSIKGTGAAQQGGTQVVGDASFTVTESSSGGSTIDVTGQVTITGKLAGIIASGASIVIKRMTREFTANISERALGK